MGSEEQWILLANSMLGPISSEVVIDGHRCVCLRDEMADRGVK